MVFQLPCFILEDVPSGSGPGQGFGIFVHIWVHSRRSAGLLPVPSQHFSKQQPSSPSGELPPQPQETPSLQAPLPPWAPPAGSAMETGRGSSDVFTSQETSESRKCDSLFLRWKVWRQDLFGCWICLLFFRNRFFKSLPATINPCNAEISPFLLSTF